MAEVPPTEFSAYPSTNTLAAGDSLLVVRGGSPYRFAGTLPAIDASGNLIVGRSAYGPSAGRLIAANRNDAEYMYSTMECFNASGVMHLAIFNGTISGISPAAAVALVGKNSVTGRSINAAGTLNASGADPCEYWRKSAGCGAILSGAVCGIDSNNELTTDFASAVRFGVKSGLINQPSFIGNDIYGRIHEQAAGPRPVRPVEGEGESAEAFEMRLGQWSALAAAWDAGLEAERQNWDRISIGGQVYIRTNQPCNAGDYVLPVYDGGGIGFAFVPDSEITFEQFRRKLGVVLTTAGEFPLIEVLRG